MQARKNYVFGHFSRSVFLVYIKDLSHKSEETAKDYTLRIYLTKPEETANTLSNDLKEINKWSFQRKMSFKPDPTKQAQEVIFSRNTTKTIHPKIFFNNIPVIKTDSQKYLGLDLD